MMNLRSNGRLPISLATFAAVLSAHAASKPSSRLGFRGEGFPEMCKAPEPCVTAARWLTGGIRSGTLYGETDDLCCNIARGRVHVHDLNATILHLLGTATRCSLLNTKAVASV